jgi:voltage-gated potassium channel
MKSIPPSSIRKKKPARTHTVVPRTRLFYALLLIVIIYIIGTVGYHIIEKWPLLDALYMTVITMTTVGFGETHDLTQTGRLFTIALILTSVGVVGYSISTIGTFILEGKINDIIRGRRMDQYISRLNNHIILCGAGRIGKYIAIEFYKTHTPFIVVEQNEKALEQLQSMGDDILFIQDDATEDETLLEAGIGRAHGLVAALGDDRDNVFIVLSARSLNSGLRIIARANEETSIEKLRKAGANEIISPNAIGGMRMASVMIRPCVVAFLDEMMRLTDQTLRFEEVLVEEGHSLANKTLEQAHIGRRTGLLVVAIRRADGNLQFNPGGKTKLCHGDVLIILGTREQINQLYALLTESPGTSDLADILDKMETS